MEHNFKSRIITSRHHNINREVLRIECKAFLCGFGLYDLGSSAVFHVDDLQILRCGHAVGFDVDLYCIAFRRLHVGLVTVVEGDVISLIADDLCFNRIFDCSGLCSTEGHFFDINGSTLGESAFRSGNSYTRIVEQFLSVDCGHSNYFLKDLFLGKFFCRFDRLSDRFAVITFDDLGCFADQSFLCRFDRLCFFGLFDSFSICRLFAFFCRFDRFSICRLFAFFCRFDRLGIRGFFAFFRRFDGFGVRRFFVFFRRFGPFDKRRVRLVVRSGFFSRGRSLDVFCDLRNSGLGLGNGYFFVGFDQIFRKYGISAGPHGGDHHYEDQNECEYTSPACGSIQCSHTAFLSLIMGK